MLSKGFKQLSPAPVSEAAPGGTVYTLPVNCDRCESGLEHINTFTYRDIHTRISIVH